MNVPIFDPDGSESGSIELPAAFEAPIRPALIQRAVVAAQANRTQRQGRDPYAGLRTPAESFGSGRGMAHVPRENGQGRRVPQTVGGRAAHPPKAEKDPSKGLNNKERQQAVQSAVAATANADVVAARGHAFDEDRTLPIVVSESFESLEKTKEALSAFEELGIAADIERADENRSIRSGRGTTRGRREQMPASILVVTSSEAGPSRAARNLAGVTVATGTNVSAEDLAPGGQPGRLTVWSEPAIEEVASR